MLCKTQWLFWVWGFIMVFYFDKIYKAQNWLSELFFKCKFNNVKYIYIAVEYHHHLTPELLFILRNWNSVSVKQKLLIFPFFEPLATTILLSNYKCELWGTLGAPYKQNHTVFVFLGLACIQRAVLKFIHVVACFRISFSGLNKTIVHPCHILFIHSSVSHYLDCFPFDCCE